MVLFTFMQYIYGIISVIFFALLLNFMRRIPHTTYSIASVLYIFQIWIYGQFQVLSPHDI
jgi:hypothetical protein